MVIVESCLILLYYICFYIEATSIVQICRVEDINVEGIIEGSVVHFHLIRTVVVESSGTISASGLGT